MNFLLNLAIAVQAARIIYGFTKLDIPALKNTEAPAKKEAVVVMQENTTDSNQIGVSDVAEFIPGCDDPGFIPSTTDGDSIGKSAGRIGVEKDCPTSSPINGQRKGKNKYRATANRSKHHTKIKPFVTVEPLLVSVEVF